MEPALQQAIDADNATGHAYDVAMREYIEAKYAHDQKRFALDHAEARYASAHTTYLELLAEQLRRDSLAP